MKKIFITLLLAFFALQFAPVQAAIEVKNTSAVSSPEMLMMNKDFPPALLNMTTEEFLNLTPKKVKVMTGQKLSFKQTLVLKAAQKQVKKQLDASDNPAGDKKSQIVALLLCFFLGGLGMHRLYLGYKNWWLMLITAGGCGIWALIDLIRIIMGDMKPADGSDYDPKL